LEELNEQMAGISLLKNTAGIVSLNLDYVSSGVYAAVAKVLDFPLIGGTTLVMADNTETGTFLFSILILTSDDCVFSCAVSDVIPPTGSVEEVTQKCYRDAIAGVKGDVSLAFLFAPFRMQYHYAGEYVKAATALNEKVPIFGTLSMAEVDNNFTLGRTLFGEESYDDRLIMMTVSGAVSPRFYIGAVSEASILMPDIGVVTKSRDNIVMEINDMGIEQFFQKIGYDPGVMVGGSQITGFLVSEKNESGDVVSSKFAGVLKLENGKGVFGDNVPEGAVLSVVTTSKENVMTTARNVVEKIEKNHDGGTVVLFSCAGRMFAMLNEPTKEYMYLQDTLSQKYNMVTVCSGGEICPTLVTDTKAYNAGHNQTLVACVF
jgi:hypothetical protein